jgi:hypothetical protein
MREGIKNWLLVFSIIVVSGIIVYFAIPREEVDKTEEVLGTKEMDLKYAPYITSVSPVSIDIGENLEYQIEISDLDTPEELVEVFLTEKPMWMYLDDKTVRGVSYDEGTYKFVVSASDGFNSTSQINYILVEAGDE